MVCFDKLKFMTTFSLTVNVIKILSKLHKYFKNSKINLKILSIYIVNYVYFDLYLTIYLIFTIFRNFY